MKKINLPAHCVQFLKKKGWQNPPPSDAASRITIDLFLGDKRFWVVFFCLFTLFDEMAGPHQVGGKTFPGRRGFLKGGNLFIFTSLSNYVALSCMYRPHVQTCFSCLLNRQHRLSLTLLQNKDKLLQNLLRFSLNDKRLVMKAFILSLSCIQRRIILKITLLIIIILINYFIVFYF